MWKSLLCSLIGKNLYVKNSNPVLSYENESFFVCLLEALGLNLSRGLKSKTLEK